jgi:hypothetical protein
VILRCATEQGPAWMAAFRQALKSAPVRTETDVRISTDLAGLESDLLSDGEIDESE